MSTHSVKRQARPFNVVTVQGRAIDSLIRQPRCRRREAPSAPEARLASNPSNPTHPSMPGRLTQARSRVGGAAQKNATRSHCLLFHRPSMRRKAMKAAVHPHSLGGHRQAETQTHPRNASIKPTWTFIATRVNDRRCRTGCEQRLQMVDRAHRPRRRKGIVIRDGVETKQRFTPAMVWLWEVVASQGGCCATCLPAIWGFCYRPETGDFNNVDVILDFYGVKTPNESGGAAQRGRQLTEDGWPVFPSKSAPIGVSSSTNSCSRAANRRFVRAWLPSCSAVRCKG